MTEQEILSYFNDRPAPAKTADLHRIRFLCNELHNPQDALKGRFLHVAGTNGKGSTCAYLDAVLRAGGMRTGLFISPFIHTFEERIQIDGAPVPLAETEAALPLLQKAERKLFLQYGETAGHFELITALAFFLFAQHDCDIVVLETGLGGRLDPTNICTPRLTVITHIAYDHTAILGDTLQKIAAEKAGILKEGVPLVLYPLQDDAAAQCILSVAKQKKCPVILPQPALQKNLKADADGLSFSYRSVNYQSRLCGLYQSVNALCAIEAALAMQIAPDIIQRGIAAAQFPARFETLRLSPRLIFDGAHNEDGIRALQRTVSAYFKTPIIGICGMLRDKHPELALAPLFAANCFETVFCVTPPSPRALDANALALIFSEHGIAAFPCADAKEACSRALALAGQNGAAVAFGSLYLANEIECAVHSAP